MKAETVANAARAQREKLDCITIQNAALRRLYGAKLKNADGTNKALGSRVGTTMAKLQEYGLAGGEHVVEFRDAGGKITTGVVRPESLDESVEA